MEDRPIGIFGAGGEIGRNIVRINTLRWRAGQESLPITHLVEGYHTRDALVELLSKDPVRGPLGGDIGVEGMSGIRIDDQVFQYVHCPVDKMMDWGRVGVWGVLEASGARVDEKLAEEHLTEGGAQKVLVTAPTKGNQIAKTLIVGYNEDAYDPQQHDVLTNESCTTKSALHPAEALRKAFGLRAISLTTVHAETGQAKRDLIANQGYVKDVSKLGFVLQSTGAKGALRKLFPGVEVSAEAYRVPVPDGSVSDVTFAIDKPTTERRVRQVLEAAVREGIWEVVETIRSSAELISNLNDAVVARDKISVDNNGRQVRIVSGYDNAYAPSRAALDAMAYVRSK